VDDRLLRRDYAIVSLILLGLKRGPDIVRFFGKPAFSDSQLPFDNRSAFVNLVGDDAFFDDFFRYQWKFCTPKLELSWGRHWEPERILPFEILRELGRGAGGRTYLIKIDHEYNNLDEGRQVNTVVRLRLVSLGLNVLTSRYRIKMYLTIFSSSKPLMLLMPMNIGMSYILMLALFRIWQTITSLPS
jgi:hypothetical protein